MMTVSDSCCNHAITLAQNTEGIDSQLEGKFREIAKECHDTAHAALQSGNGEASGLSDALLDGGNYEVDLQGERRRMLVVCTKRYHSFFEEGMISRTACAVLDHVAKEAMFSCDVELHRWSTLGFLTGHLLSCSRVPFGLGPLSVKLGADIAWGFAEAQRSMQETMSNSPVLRESESEALGAKAFLKLLNAEYPSVVEQMRVQHVGSTARTEVLTRIQRAVSSGSLHSDEATALEEMAHNFAECGGVKTVNNEVMHKIRKAVSDGSLAPEEAKVLESCF
jgi:hypothetical protein